VVDVDLCSGNLVDSCSVCGFQQTLMGLFNEL